MADFHLMQIRSRTRDEQGQCTTIRIGCGSCESYNREVTADSENEARYFARYEFSKHARGLE